MPPGNTKQLQPHSAEWFGEQRDFWWGRDFLDLMATRWRLRDISGHQDDRPAALFPPYDPPAQKVMVTQDQQWKNSATGPCDKQEMQRLFLLGGGDENFFETVFTETVKKISARTIGAGGEYFSRGGRQHQLSGLGQKTLRIF